MKQFFLSLWASRALKYALLLLIVTAVYFPSLFQAARADQLNYLYTTKDKHSLYALTLGTYSWNREINGDIHFFRPMLFLFLGLEQWAFGPGHFWAWQLVSLLFHLTVVALLFRLLQYWHGAQSWLAFLVALFFGVQYASMELVAWHHLSGYLLFCVLLLAVLCVLARCTERITRAGQASLVLLLVVAAFTLELGNILAILVAGYILCFNQMNKRLPGRGFHFLTLLGALAAPALYTAANLADQYWRYGRPLAGPALQGCLSPGAGIAGMASATGLWFQAGLLPSKVDLGVDSRMSFVVIHPTLSGTLAFQAGVALIAILAFLAMLATTSRRQLTVRSPVGLLALLFGLGFTAVIVFLRAGPRGLMSGLLSNSYYAYLFNLSAVVFLASLVDLRPLASGMSAWARCIPQLALGSALAVIAIISGWRVYEQGLAQAEWSKDTLIMVDQLQRLHQAAGANDDFSFCVALDHPGEKELPYVGPGKLDGHTITTSEVLFPHHYRREQPRYVLLKRYLGFDLVKIGDEVVGIPRRAWPRTLSNFSPCQDLGCIVGQSSLEVEMAIDSRRRGHKGVVATNQ